MKPIQINNKAIDIQDDGKTPVNSLPITITAPTTVFQGTLDDLNNSLELANSQLGIDTQKLADTTATLQANIDADNDKIASIQAMIDQVSPQIDALPERDNITPPQQITP